MGVGAQARACACARECLLIQYASHWRYIVCVLSGTIFGWMGGGGKSLDIRYVF
jgi:hypothetical protein